MFRKNGFYVYTFNLGKNIICIYYKMVKQIKAIGEMPDELSAMIQDFLRPDMTKIRAKRVKDQIHFLISIQSEAIINDEASEVIQKYYGTDEDDCDIELLYSSCNYEEGCGNEDYLGMFEDFDTTITDYYDTHIHDRNDFGDFEYILDLYEEKYDTEYISYHTTNFIKWKKKNIV